MASTTAAPKIKQEKGRKGVMFGLGKRQLLMVAPA
jgi:hypothetical protein